MAWRYGSMVGQETNSTANGRVTLPASEFGKFLQKLLADNHINQSRFCSEVRKILGSYIISRAFSGANLPRAESITRLLQQTRLPLEVRSVTGGCDIILSDLGKTYAFRRPKQMNGASSVKLLPEDSLRLVTGESNGEEKDDSEVEQVGEESQEEKHFAAISIPAVTTALLTLTSTPLMVVSSAEEYSPILRRFSKESGLVEAVINSLGKGTPRWFIVSSRLSMDVKEIWERSFAYRLDKRTRGLLRFYLAPPGIFMLEKEIVAAIPFIHPQWGEWQPGAKLQVLYYGRSIREEAFPLVAYLAQHVIPVLEHYSKRGVNISLSSYEGFTRLY